MATKPNITRFTGLQVTDGINSSNGFFVPKLSTQERDAINLPEAEKLGGLIYNTDASRLETYTPNGWTAIESGEGSGDVTGPSSARADYIASFADNTGKIIKDSGLEVSQVNNRKISSNKTAAPNQVTELGGFTYLKFSSETSAIYVDALTGIQFITNDFGSDSQVCSLITSGLPSSSSSPNALLELQSTAGAFLMSRMTSSQRDALTAVDGMILYNTTTNQMEVRENGSWISAGSGSGDVSGPASSTINNITVFADTSGKTINDSGILISDVYSAGNPTYFIERNASFYAGTDAGNKNLGGGGSFNVGVGLDCLTQYNSGDSNVGVGYRSLQQNTGNQNTALGYYCLNLNEGVGNTAIGSLSLYQNVLGKFNVAVGNISLSKNSQGSNNTAVGSFAMANAENGDSTALGYFALRDNKGNQCTGVGSYALTVNQVDYSTAVGNDALSSNTTGEKNSALGYRALANNVSSNNCSAFGFSALSTNVGDNNSAFGTSALESNTTGTNNLALGHGSLWANTEGANNIALGVQSLVSNKTSSLNIAIGNQSLFDNTASSNISIGHYSLQRNNASFNLAIGNNSLQNNINGTRNLAIGSNALNSNNTNDNLAIGNNALEVNNSGTNNLAIGNNALKANNSGTNNLAIGINSLSNCTAADNNISIGHYNLYANTTGEYNISLGNFALYDNTNGAYNIAIGDHVASHGNASGNIGIGYYALQGSEELNALSGNNNVGIGNRSLSVNTSGENNTSIGTNSLSGNDSGSFLVAVGANTDASYASKACVLLGYNAQTGNNNLTNGVAIGANAQVLVDNAMSLGKGITVGIGNSSPAYALDIGNENGLVPSIRIKSNSSFIHSTLSSDGIYFNYQGQSCFSSGNSIYSGSIVTSSSETSGVTYFPHAGPVGNTIFTQAVTSNSLILVTPACNNVTTSINLIVTNVISGQFTIYLQSNVSGVRAFWQIINPWDQIPPT